MIKKISGVFLFAILLLALTACGRSVANQWQEQYDLGQKYLLEEDYEAAVVAFTAAIEINPNEAAAYIGRGDAYMMRAAADTQTMEESYENAAVDYETALSLYAEEDDASEVIEKLGESYLALAEYYEAQGDDDMARTYYEKAYELTGDEEIAEKIEMLGQAETEEVEEEEEPEEVEGLQEELPIDEDTIEYIAKYTTDLHYEADDTVVGTASLYVCSEKEAILCAEALKNEEFDYDESDPWWDYSRILWTIYFCDGDYPNGSDWSWFVHIGWNYWKEEGGFRWYSYFLYDPKSSGPISVGSSEESVIERDGKIYTQIKFVASDEDDFDFYILENYKTITGTAGWMG